MTAKSFSKGKKSSKKTNYKWKKTRQISIWEKFFSGLASFWFTQPKRNTRKKFSINKVQETAKVGRVYRQNKVEKSSSRTTKDLESLQIRNTWQNLSQFFGYIFKVFSVTLIFLLNILFSPFTFFYKTLFASWLNREKIIQIAYLVAFLGISFRFAQLQLLTAESRFALGGNTQVNYSSEIIRAQRGQLFIQNIAQEKDNIAVTGTQVETDIFIDAQNLKDLIDRGINFDSLVTELTSRINLDYQTIWTKIDSAIQKENPDRHLVISENINIDQKQNVEFLYRSELNKRFNFQYWLGMTEKQERIYPENKLLSATIGYVPDYLERSDIIKESIKDCKEMVEKNQVRGTNSGEYMIGVYGLEQKYCSELGGLNGKRVIGPINDQQNQAVQNGADIYLTIDQNIQRKAEQVLEQAVKENTNGNGQPKNGSIVVMEIATGKLLAMASYPYFEPGEYQDYWDPASPKYNPQVFRNAATSVDYEIGSVMKPITVASALNTYDSNYVENGERKGVNSNFSFLDYGKEGKKYEELNGNIYTIQNAEGFTYENYGKLGLKEIIRDSINTGIADIVDETGARKLREHYEEKFRLGKPTLVDLPGDTHGNVVNFEKNFYCPFCYANIGYGQSFTASPLQLIRAYTAIANRGIIVEPYLVEKIIHKDGTIDDGQSPDSKIKRPKPQRIITESAANLTSQYMQAVIQEGYLGNQPSLARVDGYSLAGKTGTAEVNRPYPKLDANGKPVFDESGKQVMVPCDYTCNRKRGIYDHTFVGFGPAENPKYIVLAKLSEPNPGEVRNFSSNTVGKPFAEMMKYTLEYMGVPKNK